MIAIDQVSDCNGCVYKLDSYLNKGPYKIFENVTNEISTMKFLVCNNHCSKRSLAGSFNNIDDAATFCAIKNISCKL